MQVEVLLDSGSDINCLNVISKRYILWSHFLKTTTYKVFNFRKLNCDNGGKDIKSDLSQYHLNHNFNVFSLITSSPLNAHVYCHNCLVVLYASWTC